MIRFACLFFLLVLGGCKALLPKKYQFYIGDERWNTIRLVATNSPILLTDSMVVMYSNRNFHPEQKKVLGDYIDSTGTTHVFLATAKGGIWYLYPMQSLDEAVTALGKKRNIVCYVEGMGKNFPIALERAFSLSVQHGVTVIMMDYPSINFTYGVYKNFHYARESSFRTAPFLVKLLQEIQANKAAEKEWTKVNWTLFHHSMGNIMLKRILEERRDNVLKPRLFDQLVLNAACVNQDGHAAWLDKSQLANKTFVHYNKDDKQLYGAKLLIGKNQLGARPSAPLAVNSQYVDFNPLVGNVHSNFIDIPMRPSINPHSWSYYYKLFNGITIDFSDSTQFGKGWKGIGVYLK